MLRHDFLQQLHDRLQPRSYLEIGVNDGRSLTLSRAPSIAIDPAFRVTSEIHCDVSLVRQTSDDFFARPDPVAHLPGGVIDLAFIDGMHLSEFALRDFINVEQYSAWTSLIVLDDMLPRSVAEAARDRYTVEWAGDVYKVALVLERERPDLVCLAVDTEPTGTVIVLGADAANRSLRESYAAIERTLIVPDPQDVPPEILDRSGSADPEQVLASPVWAALVGARAAGAARDPSIYEPLRSLAGTGPVAPVVVPEPRPYPPVKPPKAAKKAAKAARPAKAAKKSADGRMNAPVKRSALRRRLKRSLRRLAARL